MSRGRQLWVQALIAAGYQIYAINPLQVARYRERHGVSGAKSELVIGREDHAKIMIRPDGSGRSIVDRDSSAVDCGITNEIVIDLSRMPKK